jgi:hypothetical protein
MPDICSEMPIRSFLVLYRLTALSWSFFPFHIANECISSNGGKCAQLISNFIRRFLNFPQLGSLSIVKNFPKIRKYSFSLAERISKGLRTHFPLLVAMIYLEYSVHFPQNNVFVCGFFYRRCNFFPPEVLFLVMLYPTILPLAKLKPVRHSL